MKVRERRRQLDQLRLCLLAAWLLVGCEVTGTTKQQLLSSSETNNTTVVYDNTTSPRAPTAQHLPVVAPQASAASDGDCPQGYTCRSQAVGPSPADKLLIEKARHKLHIVRGTNIVKSFTVALGSGGLEQKLFEGDRKTPEGRFAVSGRYPSKWHTYLALDYPGDADRARYEAAVKRGEAPPKVGAGSAIAIHGHRADQPSKLHKVADWTLGCIALDNNEIDEIAAVAPKGTTVEIIQ